MNGMESIRDLLDGSQRRSHLQAHDRYETDMGGTADPASGTGHRSAAVYAPPADHEEPSP